jgi:hypothetical protein
MIWEVGKEWIKDLPFWVLAYTGIFITLRDLIEFFIENKNYGKVYK